MPFFFDLDHYQKVVVVLLAGGVQARVVSQNGIGQRAIEVVEEDGVNVLWTNTNLGVWCWSAFAPEGDQVGYLQTSLPHDADPEAVAMAIVQQSAVMDDE